MFSMMILLPLPEKEKLWQTVNSISLSIRRVSKKLEPVFCDGDEENGQHACIDVHLTTASSHCIGNENNICFSQENRKDMLNIYY